MPSSHYHPSTYHSGGLRRLAALVALVLTGSGGCSDDDHRDKYYGTDVGTAFDVSTPLEAIPAEVGAEVGDTAGGETTDAGDAGDATAGDAADTQSTDLSADTLEAAVLDAATD
jgi:hypothetical protein